jgi:hypothetical protein
MTPPGSPYFNAHHSPIGAFASFTFGCKGPNGGLGIELGGPANEHLFIGAEDGETPGRYLAFPFFGTVADHSGDYTAGASTISGFSERFQHFPDDQVRRDFFASTDTWTAGDLEFRVLSPIAPIPDAANLSEHVLDCLCPAVFAELTLDNRDGRQPRKVFFGYQGSDRTCGMRVIEEEGLVGIGQGGSTAIVTADPMWAGLAWDPVAILEPDNPANLKFMVASSGMLVGKVPAGERRTFRFAVCFYRSGTVTTGMPGRYRYAGLFNSIEDVARRALDRFDLLTARCAEADDELSRGLSIYRALSVAHAVRSYYGSTQLLALDEGPMIWVVNEGEYRMMNTLDLIPDQAFFELRLNPWTVRNELDSYLWRYRYHDSLSGPTEPEPGGITFTHDMGASNNFSRPGYSAYEKAGLTGCFSYMSCEELTNWVLTAGLYAAGGGDPTWANQHLSVLEECLHSLLNRDHSDPAQRTGVMSRDSLRCEGGAEITTYDSLDTSLGQARGNLYLAMKWWAALVILSPIFRAHGRPDLAELADTEAALTASTVCSSADEYGLLPAVLGGAPARIIPVIEGLVFPLVARVPDVLERNGPYAQLLDVLERHLRAVLVPGVCKFPDGGWKLSSTSENSWLSKIYLCQYVAAEVFGIEDPDSDEAHWAWLIDPENAYFAWSDQMLAGKAVGSRYYPRGVTSVLWTAFRPAR